MGVFSIEDLREGISASVEDLRSFSKVVLASSGFLAGMGMLQEDIYVRGVLVISFLFSFIGYILASVPSIEKKRVPDRLTVFLVMFFSVCSLVAVSVSMMFYFV